MGDEFAKHLDDIVHQELLILRRSYNDIIRTIEPSRGSSGAVIRLYPPYEDVAFEEPEPGISPDAFAARVRRRLVVALEAPERPPAPPEDD